MNVETGQVRVLRILAAHDVGRAISPQGVQRQVEGAVLVSMGAALMEEYLSGVTQALNDCYLPAIRCTSEIEVIPVEVPSHWGPLGAKGLGEAGAPPTAPPILDVTYHASGARVRVLPTTPERVLAPIGSRAAGISEPVHGAGW